MPKQLLPHDVTSAERHSGCVWASRFRSAADEIDKGGVITGTPVFERTRGETFNGTTDYNTYGLNGQLQNASLGVHAEFYPNFAAADGAYHFIFDCTGPRTLLYKSNVNGLVVYAGNSTLILTSILADYEAYWVVGGRNLITIAATSGANNMWFNGHLIETSATAWAASNPTALHVGCRFSGTWLWNGRIASLQFYNRLLTAEDHARIWEGGGA